MEMRDVGADLFHWGLRSTEYPREVVQPSSFPDDFPLTLGSVEVDPELAPLVVRIGDTVYVSTIETGEGVPLLCNTRW